MAFLLSGFIGRITDKPAGKHQTGNRLMFSGCFNERRAISGLRRNFGFDFGKKDR